MKKPPPPSDPRTNQFTISARALSARAFGGRLSRDGWQET
jgi:hypothetical protein